MLRNKFNLTFLITIFIFNTFMQSSTFANSASQVCVDCLSFKVGPINWHHGPSDKIGDQTVEAIYKPNKSIIFDGIEAPYSFSGSDVSSATNFNSTPKLQKGSLGAFDDRGIWFHAVANCGIKDEVVAWYHAERSKQLPTNGGPIQYKSIGIAFSNDGGQTFDKPQTPRIILSIGDNFETSNGMGDHTVVEKDDYYNLYFMNWESGGVIGVARAPISSCGRYSSDWKKYCKGGWNCDGLVDNSDSLLANKQFFFLSATHYDPKDSTVLLTTPNDVFNSNKRHIQLHFSENGIDFNTAPDPLILHPGWQNDLSGTRSGYYAMVGQDRENKWNQGFWLYYMFKHAENSLLERYLVRRWVDVVDNGSSLNNIPKSVVALSRWYSPSENDHIASVELGKPGYQPESVLGYVATKEYPGMKMLEECVWPNWENNHAVSLNCTQEGAEKIRDAGYIYTSSQPSTHPIYRGFFPSSRNHFLSIEPSCEGAPECSLVGYLLN